MSEAVRRMGGGGTGERGGEEEEPGGGDATSRLSGVFFDVRVRSRVG